jgi:hypothetical protein
MARYVWSWKKNNSLRLFSIILCSESMRGLLIEDLNFLFYVIKANICPIDLLVASGNTKGGEVSQYRWPPVWPVFQIKTKIGSCHTADSKLVKQEVNCTVIPPHVSIPWLLQHAMNSINVFPQFCSSILMY